MANNYTLGRGKLYFGAYSEPATFPVNGYRFVGNAPGLTLSIETEELEHFSSTAGINEKDASVTTQVTRSGTFTLDDMSDENLALFLLGSNTTVTTASAASATYVINDVVKGRVYSVAQSAAAPLGRRGLGSVAVTSVPSGTTYVAGTDYVADLPRGTVEILLTGAIPNNGDISVAYTTLATTQTQITSGSDPIRGALRFVENNPAGTNRDIEIPLVEIRPQGEFAFIGDSWRELSFQYEALKPAGAGISAVYMNSIPL